MTQIQHTPGPWICHSGMVWKDGPNVYPKGAQEDGTPIAYMNRETPDTLPVERDANARLIATAPQLLEALEAIVFQTPQGPVLERDACISQARAAIKAATEG